MSAILSLFEEANEKLAKKGAKYHQFFAVQAAAQEDP
mgnify:CR=1 FL=1